MAVPLCLPSYLAISVEVEEERGAEEGTSDGLTRDLATGISPICVSRCCHKVRRPSRVFTTGDQEYVDKASASVACRCGSFLLHLSL